MPERTRGVGLVVSSGEQGGAEDYLVRLYSAPSIRERFPATLLGHLKGWEATGLPQRDVSLGAKWSYRRPCRSLLEMPAALRRGRDAVDLAVRESGVRAFHMQFKREQVLFTRTASRLGPVIWTEHGQLPRGPLRRPLIGAYRRAAAHVSAIICVSPLVAEELDFVLGAARPRLKVIENAIDTRWLTPPSHQERREARSALGIMDEADLVVAVVARLVPLKRVHLALEAMSWLPKAHLVVSGDGPLRAELEGEARHRGFAVTFTGYLADPRPVYRAADVLLLPSRSEGFPQVLLEAASAGIPGVVVADAGLGGLVASWGGVAEDPSGRSIAEAVRMVAGRNPGIPRTWAEAHDVAEWIRRHHDLLTEVTA